MPTKPHDHENYDSISAAPANWRRKLIILQERRWIWLTTVVVAIGLTALWLTRQTPSYRATAQILVESETMKVLNIQDVLSTDTRDLQYVNTQVKLIQSRAMLHQAAVALKLDQNAEFRKGLPAEVDSTTALDRCLAVSAERNSRLIRISAEHRSPQLATQLANGVAEEFIRENLNRKLAASMEAITWLREQAEEVKPKLAQSETALLEYREDNHAVSLEERQNIVVDKLKELNSALTRAHTERLAAEAEWNGIQALLVAGQKPIDIPAIVASEPVSALQRQLREKQIAFASLKKRYKDQYPSVVTAQAELSETAERLAAAGTEAAAGFRGRYETALAKEQSFEKALREQEQLALTLDRKLTAYNALKRNAEADRQLYDSILNRMKETSVAGKMEANNLRLVDPATPPQFPFRPRKTLMLVFGTFLGLTGGVFLSFLLHYQDDKVKTYDDVQGLGVALLSTIPRVTPRPPREQQCVVHAQPHSIVAEHFRDLRTSLLLNPRTNDAKVLLITSSIPGEGKTFIAANLGAVFAHSQERTLIIDADLRNPNQHRTFRTDATLGLSAFLNDGATFDEITQNTGVPDLDIIPAGQIPGNPLELLGSPKMKELLDLARQRYDRIVVDSPPVSAVSDALILLPWSDGVVFVVQFGKLQREFVGRTVEKLQDCTAPIIGAVLNDIDLNKHKYYYPYRSHYSHYYDQSKVEAHEIAQ